MDRQVPLGELCHVRHVPATTVTPIVPTISSLACRRRPVSNASVASAALVSVAISNPPTNSTTLS